MIRIETGSAVRWTHNHGCTLRSHTSLFSSPFTCSNLSPWYNCTCWLGVKHQLTYLLFWLVQQLSLFQDSIFVFRKAHLRTTMSLRMFPNVAFETVPIFIRLTMAFSRPFVRLTMALSRPFKEDCLVLPLSMPLSSRRSMVWCPWLCACR